MKEKEMKNKGGSLTQLANLTNIWWTNKWTKFKASERDDRGGGGGAGVEPEKQVLSSQHVTGRAQEKGALKAARQT